MPPNPTSIIESIVEQGRLADCDIPRGMPSVFRPPMMGGGLTSTGLYHARSMPPFRILPRFLVGPRVEEAKNHADVPPTFYYGWRPDLKKMRTFAEARGLMVVLPSTMYGDGYGAAKIEGDEELITFRLVIKTLMRELGEEGISGPWCQRVRCATTLRQDDENRYIVSVLTNYEVHCELPTSKELMKLQRELQTNLGIEDGPPTWYVDEVNYEWNLPELSNAFALPENGQWHVEYDAEGCQTVTQVFC